MTHSHWINTNYCFLEKWCKHWRPDEWAELLSQYVIYLNTKWDKFDSIPDGNERLKWSQKWLRDNSKWTNSEFNKEVRINNLPEEWVIEDCGEDSLIEHIIESDRPDIRLWIRDLNLNFSELEVERLMRIRGIYLRLDTHEKVLYNLYFDNMLSMRDIASKIGLPLSAIHIMIGDLKKKIKSLV